MSPHNGDEETPLLPPKKRTPLPLFQFSIILFLQLAEPLTSQVIYPFAPQLIRDIGITHGDEARVGYYVGIMQSLFFLTQAVTVLHWAQLSDRVGRKPVILIGLFGLSISMYCFGLSKTFIGLVLSRALSGMLNGNIGVIKSMLAEITDSTNIAQAYGAMPIAWSAGSTLGPMIGGFLLNPTERFPGLFGDSEFLKTYPYFLPCAVPATFSVLAWIVTFLYLKETVSSPISFSKLFSCRDCKMDHHPENIGSEEPPSPTVRDEELPLSLRAILVPRVIIAAANYASLSLVDISYRAIQPLFLSTPIELGGLGLSPPEIGKIMSIFGLLNGFLQVFVFAPIHDRWGSKKIFMLGILASIPMFACFPYLNYLARSLGVNNAVWMVIGLQVVLSVILSLSFGAIFIYIAASSPNRASLGTTNGLAQMTVSVVRAIGPAVANSLFSLSIEKQYFGGLLVYWVLIGISAMSVVLAAMLPKNIASDR